MKFCIALGSNLGDRVSLIQAARDQLIALPDCGGLLNQAPLYESAPVDCPDGSGAFLNTAIEIEWAASPLSLLEAALNIEAELGRIRSIRNAPRPVDIDLICAENLHLDHPKLILPHPRLHLRRFVLEPLAQLRPDQVLPGQQQTIIELLKALDPKTQALEIFQENW